MFEFAKGSKDDEKITYLALTLVATGLTACANSPENGVSNNTNMGQAQCLPAEAKNWLDILV